MAETCPKCRQQQLMLEQKSGAYAGGGLVGFMIMRAFSGKHMCPTCGVIVLADFPPDVKNKILLKKAALVIGALVLLVVVLAIVIAVQM